LRTRELDAEVPSEDREQPADVERADVESRRGAGPEPPVELARTRAGREERADRLVTQPAQREQERARRGRVQPLEVVNRDDDGLSRRQCRDRVEHGQADRARFDRCDVA